MRCNKLETGKAIELNGTVHCSAKECEHGQRIHSSYYLPRHGSGYHECLSGGYTPQEKVSQRPVRELEKIV